MIAKLLAIPFLLCAPAFAGETKELSAEELASILGVKHWRLPVAPTGSEWTIYVAPAVALPKESRHLGDLQLGPRDAMIALRPLSGGEYEITLNQGATSSRGSFIPCNEPDGSRSICDSYSIRFERDPVCLPGCNAFVIATLESDGPAAIRKQVLISQIRSLVVRPGDGAIVTPVRGK